MTQATLAHNRKAARVVTLSTTDPTSTIRSLRENALIRPRRERARSLRGNCIDYAPSQLHRLRSAPDAFDERKWPPLLQSEVKQRHRSRDLSSRHRLHHSVTGQLETGYKSGTHFMCNRHLNCWVRCCSIGLVARWLYLRGHKPKGNFRLRRR